MQKSLFVGFIGIAILCSPLDAKLKTVCAIVTATPLSFAVYQRSKQKETIKYEIERLKEELADLDHKSKDAKLEIESRIYKLDLLATEIAKRESKVNADLDSAEKIRSDAITERDRILLVAKQDAERIVKERELAVHAKLLELEQFEKQILDSAERTNKKTAADLECETFAINQERKSWEAEKRRIHQWVEEQKRLIEDSKNEALSERARLKNLMLSEMSRLNEKTKAEVEAMKIKVQAEIEILEAQSESAIALHEARINRELSELESKKQSWELQKQKERDLLKDELEEFRLDHLEGLKEEQAEVINQLAAQMAEPYIAQLRSAEAAINRLKNELRVARENLARKQKVIKPQVVDQISTMAFQIITFFEERSAYIDYVNIYEHDKQIYLIFRPAEWFWHGAFQFKAIAKYFDELVDFIKLEEHPTTGHSPAGFALQMTPRSPLFLTGNAPPPASTDFTPMKEELSINTLNTDPVYVMASESIETQDVEKDIASFIEPTNFCEKSGDITETEKRWILFLWKYRQQFSGKPDIRNQNELLLRVWGVHAGRGTDDEVQSDGKTLRDRLHLILDLLGIDRNIRKRQ